VTDQQKAFADYFLECGNQTEAAKRAGYSERSAYSQGNRLLKSDEVSAYIAERMKPREDKRIATADEVMEFLSKGMRGEIKDQFGLDPSLTDRINCAKELMKRYVAGQNAKENSEGVRILRTADGGIEVDDGC
jgi:phage terminase small subunit